MAQPNMERPAESGSSAIGLGLTNECNLACSFCYRDPTCVDRLSLEQVQAAMASLPVRSVNLGTGENGMHPEFREILAFLRTLPAKLTITSNEHSAAVLSDDEIRAFHDIEFPWITPLKASRMRNAVPAIGH
jgi:MoaA/NifB/PqqE/SkfB family radical SAM enzyme